MLLRTDFRAFSLITCLFGILLSTACLSENCDEVITRYDSGGVYEQTKICYDSVVYTRFYQNGYKMIRVKDGWVHKFDSTGTLLWSAQSVNDTLHGVYREYHEQGNLKIEKNMAYGLEDGPYREYYLDGRLRIDASYVNGLLTDYNEYYWNGRLMWKISYMQGEPMETIKYDSLGNVSEWKVQ
jgi:antitoxin component YwqK of YwqJK toxin-antitoxin module